MTTTQNRIHEAKQSLPIRSLSDSDFTDLIKHLGMMSGVDIQAKEVLVCSQFLKNNYATLGKLEIILAFEFGFAGKYPVETQRTITPRFMGSILVQYEKFKAVEMKGLDYYSALPERSEVQKRQDEENLIQLCYQRWKENQENAMNPNYKEKWYPASIIYDYLIKQGVKLRIPEKKDHNSPQGRTEAFQRIERSGDPFTNEKTEIVNSYFKTLNP